MAIRKIWTTRYTKEQLPLYYEKWRNYNVMQGWNLPYSDQHIKDLNYVCIDEISNQMNGYKLLLHCGFSGV